MSINKKFKSKAKGDSSSQDPDTYSESESSASNALKEGEHDNITNLSLGGDVKKNILSREPVLSARDHLKVKTKNHTTKFLVDDCIAKLAERNGSSLIAIKKYIAANNPERATVRLNGLIKRYIKKAVNEGTIIQNKGRFKLAANTKTVKQKAKPKTKLMATENMAKAAKMKRVDSKKKPSTKDVVNGKKEKNLAKTLNSQVVDEEEIIEEKKFDENNNPKSKLKRKSIVTAKTTMVAIKSQIENKKKPKGNQLKPKKEKIQSKAIKKGPIKKQQEDV